MSSSIDPTGCFFRLELLLLGSFLISFSSFLAFSSCFDCCSFLLALSAKSLSSFCSDFFLDYSGTLILSLLAYPPGSILSFSALTDARREVLPLYLLEADPPGCCFNYPLFFVLLVDPPGFFMAFYSSSFSFIIFFISRFRLFSMILFFV